MQTKQDVIFEGQKNILTLGISVSV